MTRRLPHLAIALIAISAMLPAAALAATAKKHPKGPSDCGTSAVCVYHESGQSPSGSQPLGSSHKATPLSSKAARKLAKFGGKDKALLKYLATRQGVEPLAGARVGHVSSPGTFLAALDLGAGPIALFATLLAGAAAFAGGRALRRRRAAGHSS